jgi:RNA recognition motif-containing protein
LPTPLLQEQQQLQQQLQQPHQHTVNKKSQDCVSIYISNLPPFIEEEDLRILFERIGNIKRVKLYRDQNGLLKGDACVTFDSVLSVEKSVCLYNGKDLGDGERINVSKANFNSNSEPAENEAGQLVQAEEGFEVDDFLQSLLG